MEDRFMLFASKLEPSTKLSMVLKIWILMQVHYPKAESIDDLNLLKQCSWSARITEQGHNAASMVMKRHHTYTAVTMQDRALMVAAKQLCDAVS